MRFFSLPVLMEFKYTALRVSKPPFSAHHNRNDDKPYRMHRNRGKIHARRPYSETALYVRDVAEAIGFYRDVMGLEPVGKVSERNASFGVAMAFSCFSGRKRR